MKNENKKGGALSFPFLTEKHRVNSMVHELCMKLIAEGIIDFNKLLLANYQILGLSETGAFVVIELFRRGQKGERILNPEKLAKSLAMPPDQVMQILETLMKQELLTIEMVPGVSGKESESYHLNNVVSRIITDYEKRLAAENAKPKVGATTEEEIVNMLESGFQKQLTPIEIEIIKKWVSEDGFQLLDIRRAVLDAVKANKHSLSYVDSLLVKRRAAERKTDTVKYDSDRPEALKNFFDSWPKK